MAKHKALSDSDNRESFSLTTDDLDALAYGDDDGMRAFLYDDGDDFATYEALDASGMFDAEEAEDIAFEDAGE